jgi:hypothetical protein
MYEASSTTYDGLPSAQAGLRELKAELAALEALSPSLRTPHRRPQRPSTAPVPTPPEGSTLLYMAAFYTSQVTHLRHASLPQHAPSRICTPHLHEHASSHRAPRRC